MAVSLLQVSGLSKSFGGVHALSDLSFSVDANIIHSIIGPNGAGKTTLFNLITGVYTPSAGSIHYNGEDVTGLPPHKLAGLGISRTFQNLQVFFNMTVLENVMVGRHLHCNRSFVRALVRAPAIVRAEVAEQHTAIELLLLVGLEQYINQDADALPYGALKRLEIARALAAEPKVLLLDEPAAGLNINETREMKNLIQQIAGLGMTVFLVEHDMRLVMDVSDRILVLDHGRWLAAGTAEEVRKNPDVITAYLGSDAVGEG
jgi:branched-chain amino acid transport system ATP-binding protein